MACSIQTGPVILKDPFPTILLHSPVKEEPGFPDDPLHIDAEGTIPKQGASEDSDWEMDAEDKSEISTEVDSQVSKLWDQQTGLRRLQPPAQHEPSSTPATVSQNGDFVPRIHYPAFATTVPDGSIDETLSISCTSNDDLILKKRKSLSKSDRQHC